MTHVHHIAGRLRLKFPDLRNRRELAGPMEKALRRLQDVKLAQINTVTGSLLVHYDVRGKREQDLLRAVEEVYRRFGLSLPVVRYARRDSMEPCALASHGANDLLGTLVGMAIEKCVQRSAVALVAALL